MLTSLSPWMLLSAHLKPVREYTSAKSDTSWGEIVAASIFAVLSIAAAFLASTVFTKGLAVVVLPGLTFLGILACFALIRLTRLGHWVNVLFILDQIQFLKTQIADAEMFQTPHGTDRASSLPNAQTQSEGEGLGDSSTSP